MKAAVSGEYNVGLWLLQDGYYRKHTVDNGRLGLLEGTWGDSYNFHDNSVRVAESKYLGSHIGYPLGRIETESPSNHFLWLRVRKVAGHPLGSCHFHLICWQNSLLSSLLINKKNPWLTSWVADF